ncbi:MAG TPA: hypothetical protein VH063_09765 [Gaiellaceae bacterium]|jgi:hypothetical protein|nr:hypothetical protein [Gaiellaceae bacterium]
MSHNSIESPAEQQRLRILIEQLQRQGKTEQQINRVLDEAVAERALLRPAL